MRFLLAIVSLSVFISVVFSAPGVPLRGTLKEDDSTNVSTTTAAPKKIIVRSTEEGTTPTTPTTTPSTAAPTTTPSTTAPGGSGGASSISTDEGDEKTDTDGSGGSGGTTDETTDETVTTTPDPMEKCGLSFVMWFVSGTPVTTLECGPYTMVYGPIDGETNPAARYVSGTVTTVTYDTNSKKLMINNQEFATLSTDSSNPTAGSTTPGAGARLLAEGDTATEAVAMTDLYTFTLKGGKAISVGVPVSEDPAKRDKYSLSADNQTFYTGTATNSGATNGIFKLNSDGDLVDPSNNVILRDADSAAFGFRYIVPSVFAIFAAFFMF